MRFKSIFAAFLFISLTCMVALLIFVQTKSFGRVATKIITDLSQRRAQVQVGVKDIGISLFPPGIELNQVKVKKVISPDEKFEAEFGRLGFYIGFIELEEKKITLGEIRISDSTIDYYSPKDDTELKKIDQEIIDRIFNISDELPVRIDTVLLENSKIVVNHELIEAKRLKIFKRGDSFMVRFHLANLKPSEEVKFSLDEIWGDAEVNRSDVKIQRLKVQHNVHTLLLKGKIKNYPLLKDAQIAVSGEASIHLNNLKEDVSFPDLIKLDQGFAHLSFKTSAQDQKMKGSLELSVSDLESNFLHARQIVASLELKDDVISLFGLNITNGEERLKLLASKEIFNLKTKRYLYQPLSVNVDKFTMTNALRVLPSLKVLKGNLTGNLTFAYQNENMEFIPKDGFLVHDLGLVVGEEKDPFTILMIKRAKLTSTSMRLINKEFQMDSMIELNHSLLDIHGFVNSNFVNFKAKDAIIDLEDFGNISQLDIKGKGTLDITVNGEISDTTVNLRGKTNGFEVLGYKLGMADKDISVALGDSSVIIHRLEAMFRNTPISGTGVINYGNKDIALGINSPKANLHDLKDVLQPIFSKLTFLPSDLDMTAKVDVNIYGKTSMDQLKLKSEIEFTDFVAYGESLSSGDFKIGLTNKLLTIKDLTANKGKGQIRGDFLFNLNTDQMKLDYEWDEIALSSFSAVKKANVNLNGEIYGSLRGEGSTSDYLLKLEGKMIESRTQDFSFDDSKFNFDITPTFMKGKASLLGRIIETDFDYSFNHSRPSRIDFNVSAPELKPFATAFLGQHLETENFSGALSFKGSTQFKGNFKDVDLKVLLQKLAIKHESFSVNYSSSEPQFLIENDIIKRWNLSISEPDLFIKASGRGRIGDEVLLKNEINFNSKIFELLLSQVLSAEGFIKSIVKIEGRNDQYDLTASSSSADLNLTIESIPFPLNQLSYKLDFANNRLLIEELKTSLENGSLSMKGDVFFDNDSPDINIKYSLDKAEIPILGKSVINLSGEGIILGNEPPYSLGGEIVINKAQIVNELTEFAPKSNALAQIRFLPANQESVAGKLINLNINVKADNPVRITNSLMDVSMKGEIMILGNPARPKGEGHLYSPPNSSRVFFKNSEYYITNADLHFTPKKEISNPDFDVQAMTVIASYKVYAKAYGDLERFNFDLTSDPSLPRNSILSLIAFGYTDDLQNSLQQKDQQNLTQVGVGSFVFDRFKISDILNKQFGLQVNLGTVLEQSQTDSLLSGRNQGGQGTLGRTRSATKIELKKRLDEALSLSVSSTMGGSIGQRQSMNLNYSVSKKVQLEGVYEVRTNDEGQAADIINNSIGGDLKFRWTFK